MVRLKNIKKNEDNHTIQADYMPEFSEEVGFVLYDYVTEKIIDSKLTSTEDILPRYRYHAANGLRDIIKDESEYGIPETYTVMWY